MIVFDITDLQSFYDATGYWFEEIRQSCPQETKILLVGNKSDLEELRKVSIESIEKFVGMHPEVRYIETSAKTAEKVEEAFGTIV
jgi:GTPase SAR1 family protein